MSEIYKIVATTYAGLEEVLAKELIDLQANNVQIVRRAVQFTGNLEMVYRANYSLRTALKILVNLKSFSIKNAEDLYHQAFKIKWETLFDSDYTFAVQSVVFSDKFKSSMFAGLRVKDAIADRFRKFSDKRPSVDSKFPQIIVNLHISNNDCSISLDSSGESLHKRGYKIQKHEAPISEVLAAGMLMLSGWDKKTSFADPMCGSGTIVIEAAMMAKNIRPGDIGRDYAFMNWKNFDIRLLQTVKIENNITDADVNIYGSDISRKYIESCFIHAEKAKVDDIVRFKQKDFVNFERPKKVTQLIFNPPYGERINSGDKELYDMIGERLKHEFEDCSAWIISTNECFKWVGLKPTKKYALLNGSLECSFRKYDLYKGSKKIED